MQQYGSIVKNEEVTI